MLLAKHTFLLFFQMSLVYLSYADVNSYFEVDKELNDKTSQKQHEEDSVARDIEKFLKTLLDEDQLLDSYALKKTKIPKYSFPAKCSKFQISSDSSSIASCGNVTTLLGAIQWCRISCKKNYHLVKATPKYEICGKATKHRWTYQLRGLQTPMERCIKGASTSNVTVQTCTTPECFSSAAFYMNNIDFSINPCDDFYKFACGGLLKHSHYILYNAIFTSSGVVADRMHKDVSQLLMQPINSSEWEPVTKAKIAYKACMNLSLIEELDSQPMLDILQGYMAWPILDPFWDPKSFNFESTVARLRGIYNNKVVMHVDVKKRNGQHVLQALKGPMSIPVSLYLDNSALYKEKLGSYYSFMYDIALMLGADPEVANRDVREIKEFEKELAFSKFVDSVIPVNKTLDELNQEIPEVDWLRMFKEMMLSHPINGSTKVNVTSHAYLNNLAKLVEMADKRVVQNYLVWTNVRQLVHYLSSRFRNRSLELKKVITGRTGPVRWKYCTRELLKLMKGSTGKLFIDHYYPKARRNAAKEIVNYTRKGLLKILKENVTWMDNATKSYARRKALALKPRFGYNSHIYNNRTYLIQQTEYLNLTVIDYFGNTKNLLTNFVQNKFKLIGVPYDNSVHAFTIRPTLVNAMYNLEHNVFTLPAGETQYPFYWGTKFPMMIEFGGVGTTIGHELTHAFDTKGRKRGIHGELVSWWTPGSLAKYKKRVKCMEDQYSSFYYKAAGKYLNGKLEIPENIADNGGVKEAFVGYQLWLKAHNLTSEGLEPATGFTSEQMFFLAFANDRCSKLKHSVAVRILHDVHAPARFRVIGPLQNYEKFSEAFNCPLGSYMNPAHKCIIW